MGSWVGVGAKCEVSADIRCWGVALTTLFACACSADACFALCTSREPPREREGRRIPAFIANARDQPLSLLSCSCLNCRPGLCGVCRGDRVVFWNLSVWCPRGAQRVRDRTLSRDQRTARGSGGEGGSLRMAIRARGSPEGSRGVRSGASRSSDLPRALARTRSHDQVWTLSEVRS